MQSEGLLHINAFYLSLVLIIVARSPQVMAMCVYYANDMHIIFKLGPCKSCSSGFSEVPIKHGLVITSSIQLSEVVYRLTKLWLVSLIFFRPLNPLEMVVPTCDDYKVGPHQTWKPVCVCDSCQL